METKSIRTSHPQYIAMRRIKSSQVPGLNDNRLELKVHENRNRCGFGSVPVPGMGQMQRIQNRNPTKEVDFFCGKLMHRGYCRAKFEQIFKLYPFDGKFCGKASGNQAVAAASVIPLKIRYFPGLEHLKLGQTLQHYKFMLDARAREKCNSLYMQYVRAELISLEVSAFSLMSCLDK